MNKTCPGALVSTTSLKTLVCVLICSGNHTTLVGGGGGRGTASTLLWQGTCGHNNIIKTVN